MAPKSLVFAAAAASALLACPALAQDASLDRLEAVCVDDGSEPSTCECLRGFVAENFSQREIDGAALVLGSPELRDDFPAAFAALEAAGYGIDEMVTVYTRIVELEEQAQRECEAPGVAPPAAQSDSED